MFSVNALWILHERARQPPIRVITARGSLKQLVKTEDRAPLNVKYCHTLPPNRTCWFRSSHHWIMCKFHTVWTRLEQFAQQLAWSREGERKKSSGCRTSEQLCYVISELDFGLLSGQCELSHGSDTTRVSVDSEGFVSKATKHSTENEGQFLTSH